MARIVLVADDSPTIQKRAMGILKADGFEVETVSNGVAAIKRLGVLRPVVVLADVSMPGRDGYEVCDFVKKSPDLAQVPVILIASDMEPYDSARGAQVKADGIIKKPFEARELISVVVKFAEQFEAAAISVADVQIAPPPGPEPVREFSLGEDQQDSVPTVVQQVEPGFANEAGGVAFAQPTSEEDHPFPLDFGGNGRESAFDRPHASIGDYPLVAETPIEPTQFSSPTSSIREDVPPFMEHLNGAAAQPRFIEEHAGQIHAETQEALRTAIFHTPMATLEESPKDDTLTATADAEFTDHGHPEPQFITEEPELDISHEHSHEHPHHHNAIGATSLDSFSLDDATAGQVRFATAIPEVVYAAPAEENAALEVTPPEPAQEAVHAVTAGGEAAPEVVYAEPVPIEPAPEVVYADPSAAEPETAAVADDAPAEAREAETTGKAVDLSLTGETEREEAVASQPSAEVTPFEPVVSEPPPAAAVGQVTSTEPSTDETQAALASEPSAAEPSHPEFHLPMAATAGVVAASVVAAVEAVHTGVTHDAGEEHVQSESTIAESGPESMRTDGPTPESLFQGEPAEPTPSTAPPIPGIDGETLHAIVLKVVMKMAPPMLTAEAVEQIARHLTEEIATEISLEVPKSEG